MLHHFSVKSLPRKLCTIMVSLAGIGLSTTAYADHPTAGKVQDAAAAKSEKKINITKDTKLLSFTSELNDSTWAIKNLFDGKVGEGHGWSSNEDPDYPQKLLLKLSNRMQLTEVAINPQAGDDSKRWARDVIIEAGDTEIGPWTNIGQYRLWEKGEYQHKKLLPTFASYLRITIESNRKGGQVLMGDIKFFSNGVTPDDVLDSIKIFPDEQPSDAKQSKL